MTIETSLKQIANEIEDIIQTSQKINIGTFIINKHIQGINNQDPINLGIRLRFHDKQKIKIITTASFSNYCSTISYDLPKPFVWVNHIYDTFQKNLSELTTGIFEHANESIKESFLKAHFKNIYQNCEIEKIEMTPKCMTEIEYHHLEDYIKHSIKEYSSQDFVSIDADEIFRNEFSYLPDPFHLSNINDGISHKLDQFLMNNTVNYIVLDNRILPILEVNNIPMLYDQVSKQIVPHQTINIDIPYLSNKQAEDFAYVSESIDVAEYVGLADMVYQDLEHIKEPNQEIIFE